jgi:stage V sporulation protein AD
MQRQGKRTIVLTSKPSIVGNAAVVGKTEGEGPLKNEFDFIYDDDMLGEKSFEKAESALQKDAVMRALQRAGKLPENIDLILAGDLLNQNSASNFALRELGIPFVGLFGACSTMALTLGLASILVEAGAGRLAVAATSSHFCSAERQFRMPLEYGGQRSPSAQRTVTGAGASVISTHNADFPSVSAVTFGKIVDFGIRDATNMGAAMAPAAADTVSAFFADTNSDTDSFDYIITGDLGHIGSELMLELLQKDYGLDISSKHTDCGKMIFDRERQDTHAGGSGCGCSASVLNSYFINRLKTGEIKNILFIATGALMSPTTSLQGESIPSIAHLVSITKPDNVN